MTTEQIDEDLAYLRLAVRNGYVGPRSLVDAVDQLSAAKIKASDSASFCSALQPAFASTVDRHLRAYLNYQPCAPLTQLIVGQVGANITPSGQVWSLSSRLVNGQSIAVLSIAHFASENDPGWYGFLDAVEQLRELDQPFVLDLRGNSGGDDDFGLEMAHILYGFNDEATLPLPVDSMLFVQTPESYAIQLSYWNYRIARAESEQRQIPDAYTDRVACIQNWYDKAASGKYPSTYDQKIPAVSVDPRAAFSKNIYVLVDRACASACETTLQALEALPHRILVGENTYGAVEYGDVGLVVLPNSHVAVQLATTWNRFRDHRHPEGIGYAPKIEVPAGTDALTAAVPLTISEPSALSRKN